MSHPRAVRASFRALSEATPDDWKIIDAAESAYRRDLGPARRLLKILASLEDGDPLGAPVNLYRHSLQTATRVLQAGRDDELVVVALFHDFTEAFSESDHGPLAAQLLAPWISERRSWLLTHHGEFQDYHFANHPTRDRQARDRHLGHPCFSETAEFCERYDQNSFDPGFESLPLAAFETIVLRFCSKALPPT